MNVTILRIFEFMFPLAIVVSGVAYWEPALFGLEYPLNIFVLLIVGYIPVLAFNFYVPAKCPNAECEEIKLYKEQIFPSITSNGYICRSCRKKFEYSWGDLSETGKHT